MNQIKLTAFILMEVTQIQELKKNNENESGKPLKDE